MVFTFRASTNRAPVEVLVLCSASNRTAKFRQSMISGRPKINHGGLFGGYAMKLLDHVKNTDVEYRN